MFHVEVCDFVSDTGTSALFAGHPELLDGSFDDIVPREVCRMDTGQGKKLRSGPEDINLLYAVLDTLTHGNLCIGMFRINYHGHYYT